MFLMWTQDASWLYGAEATAYWLSEEKDVMALTITFGRCADPISGEYKTIKLSINHPGAETIDLKQGAVNLNISITWVNPEPNSPNQQFAITGSMIQSGIVNAGFDACFTQYSGAL